MNKFSHPLKKAMSIDSLVVGQDDALLNSLDFSLPATSSYLLERRSVVYMSENGGTYSPSSVRVVRWRLTGSYIDPSTLRVRSELRVNSRAGATEGEPTKLYPTGPMHVLFKRFRCIVSGQSAEDVNDFGRTSEVIYRRGKPIQARASSSRLCQMRSRAT